MHITHIVWVRAKGQVYKVEPLSFFKYLDFDLVLRLWIALLWLLMTGYWILILVFGDYYFGTIIVTWNWLLGY